MCVCERGTCTCCSGSYKVMNFWQALRRARRHCQRLIMSLCQARAGKGGGRRERLMKRDRKGSTAAAAQCKLETSCHRLCMLLSSLPFGLSLYLSPCLSDFWSSHLYYVARSFVHKLMQLKYNTHTHTCTHEKTLKRAHSHANRDIHTQSEILQCNFSCRY